MSRSTFRPGYWANIKFVDPRGNVRLADPHGLNEKRSPLKSTWFLTAWRIWRQHFSTLWSLLLTRFSWSVDAETKVRQVCRLSISSFKGSTIGSLARFLSVVVHNSMKANLWRQIEHKKSSKFLVTIKRIFQAFTCILKKKISTWN